MKKLLIPLIIPLLLVGCNQPKQRKKSSSIVTSVVPTSASTSLSSASATSKFSTSARLGEFVISDTALNIDWKDTTSFNLSSGIGGISPNEKVTINWSVSALNIVRYEYSTTGNFEENIFTIFSTGELDIFATWKTYTVTCHVKITNSNQHKTSGKENLKIYAMNDFHGQVVAKNDIKIIGSFLKEKLSDPNTLFIDSGDTWQGSLESNYNYGAMITDVYNYAGATSRTVGNHDFDWGQDKLAENVQRSFNGMRTTTLAANVYDFDFETKKPGDTFQKQFGEKYKVVNLRSGLKVGIIGTIGEGQITSISTQLVSNIYFKDHIETTMEISDYLRNNEQCDVVIASFHEPVTWTMENELTNISPVSKKKYVDLVFNGHSHALETEQYNGVIFAQYASNGNFYGEVNLTYDYAAKTTNATATDHYFFEMESDLHRINPVVEEIVEGYLSQTKDIGKQVLTNNCGSLSSYIGVPGLICKAMYDEAIAQNFDVSYTYANSARSTLNGPTITFSDLYTALPFDNQIYILAVPGSTLITQFYSTDRTAMYRGNNQKALKAIKENEIYYVATLDYLAFHTNDMRYYDYFPDCEVVGKLAFEGYYTYRELVRDYILKHQDLTYSDATFSSGPHYDKGQIYKDIVE